MALDIVALALANKANKRIDDIPNGVRALGEVNYYSELPSSGNALGDSYTVKNDENEYKAGRYAWGTSNGQLTWYPLEAKPASLGTTLVDIGSDQESIDGKVFPRITREKAEEIYSLFSSGISVIVKWNLMGVLPIESQVISTETAGGRTFDMIFHNEFLCEYSITSEPTAELKVVKIGGAGGSNLLYIHNITISCSDPNLWEGEYEISLINNFAGELDNFDIFGNVCITSMVKLYVNENGDGPAVGNFSVYYDAAQEMSYMLLIEKDGIKSLPITEDTLILGPDEVSPLEAAGGMMMMAL